MNERIRELARRAGAHVSTRNLMSNPPQHIETVELWDDRIEKFAELIVKECAQVCRDQPNVYALKADRDNCAIAIEQHFGVEELPVCKHDWYSAKNPVVQNGSVCVICGAIDAREPEELKNDTRVYP